MDWRERFEAELSQAQRARGRGNEGQARVCARRAAGIVAVEYLRRQGSVPRTSSAIDSLRYLLLEPSIQAGVLPLIEHLLLPVSTDFKLPPGIDLLEEARRLRSLLLLD